MEPILLQNLEWLSLPQLKQLLEAVTRRALRLRPLPWSDPPTSDSQEGLQ